MSATVPNVFTFVPTSRNLHFTLGHAEPIGYQDWNHTTKTGIV